MCRTCLPIPARQYCSLEHAPHRCVHLYSIKNTANVFSHTCHYICIHYFYPSRIHVCEPVHWYTITPVEQLEFTLPRASLFRRRATSASLEFKIIDNQFPPHNPRGGGKKILKRMRRSRCKNRVSARLCARLRRHTCVTLSTYAFLFHENSIFFFILVPSWKLSLVLTWSRKIFSNYNWVFAGKNPLHPPCIRILKKNRHVFFLFSYEWI